MKCSICGGNVYLDNGLYICHNCKNVTRVKESTTCDVFICCTHTSPQGNPTVDGMMASDIYNRLESSGIKVFYSPKSFSETSSEERRNVLKSAIESARIIVVTGSSKFNFINAMSYHGESFKNKAVLPVYSAMSADDIPRTPEMFPAVNYDNKWSLDNICNDIRGILKLLESKDATLTPAEKRVKQRNNTLIIGVLITLAILLGITAYLVLVAPKISNAKDYSKAQTYSQEGKYVEAIDLYTELENYKDSVDLLGKIYSKYNGSYYNSEKSIELTLKIVNKVAKIEISEEYGNKAITTKTSANTNGTTIIFDYTDSANVSGTGTIELYNDYIQLIIKSETSDEYCISSGKTNFLLDERYTNTTEETEEAQLYYVRTSANNIKSQIGEFSILEDAKFMADKHEDEGYKVFDSNGKLIYTPNSTADNDSDKPTSTDDTQLYYVRTSANNTKSQIGAFSILENAKSLANKHKDKGYKVYDYYGNLVYTPNNTPSNGGTKPSTNSGNDGSTSSTNDGLYKVRKSAYDKDSQIGAFANYSNAVSLANKRKAEGYKVFDSNGNLLYNPYGTSNGGSATPSATNNLYKVRKSANDSDSQIGAFSDFNNAVSLANSRKSEGYKVYDSNGFLVYTP